MLFEGSEKKAEVLIDPARLGDLRSLGRPFWEEIVARSQATVLSTISTEACDAYLLSESSLFVCADRFTMLTCGQTRLVDAVDHFLAQHAGAVRALFYQRKNELFPHLQHTDFRSDVAQLRAHLPGEVFEFGNAQGHFNHILYYEREPIDASDDVTVEFLMYGLRGPARELFGGAAPDGAEARQAAVRALFADTGLYRDFAVDDYFFDPCGYSVNGVRGDRYWTIHVTPEEEGSYASFETNLDLATYDPGLFDKLARIFGPRSTDIVLFQAEHPGEGQVVQGHELVDFSRRRLGGSYEVRFYHQTRSR